MDNRTYTALVVPASNSEPIRIEQVAADLQALEALVGGPLESVIRGDWHVYLNAESVTTLLPVNVRAGQLMHECGLDLNGIRGTAVFLGRGDHGAEADIPDHLARLAEELFGAPLAA
ncbi:hypothetical protein PUN71_007840 [Arthrobacter sp. NQ7]|uniref:DUF3846 domain-containing protein n=1 Tax=Pseudarthrobacter phenanthrenivorans TaxID=361575 RepID=A0A0B4DJV3_PSEPS|nr:MULTISPECIES: hypothetical protein [Micrococcaceae]KIC66976.1 hypothetical protein RM50_09670 [Pseudarthrobacter phenanthrenivorans]MDJ0457104.1 hypothetical protein [Arthrobacter sp. NQ7]